eukprot:833351_1
MCEVNDHQITNYHHNYHTIHVIQLPSKSATTISIKRRSQSPSYLPSHTIKSPSKEPTKTPSHAISTNSQLQSTSPSNERSEREIGTPFQALSQYNTNQNRHHNYHYQNRQSQSPSQLPSHDIWDQ